MEFISDWVFQVIGQPPVDLSIFAQTINDPNLLGQIQKSFTNFVQTGQAWALLIGLVIGYMIRNLTSYG
jgi:hypothetical protein